MNVCEHTQYTRRNTWPESVHPALDYRTWRSQLLDLEPLPVPGLLDLQTESFEWFIGSEEWQERAASRGTTNLEGGLESILKEK